MKHTEHDSFLGEALETLNRIHSENSSLKELRWFLENAARRFNSNYLRSAKPQVIVLGDDIPAEIIYAVCDQPFFILGGSLEAAHWADELTPRDTDPLSRSSLGWLINPSFELKRDALIVTAVSSDSRRKLISILKNAGGKVEAIDVPPDHKSKNALNYYTDQLTSLAEKISKHTGKCLSGHRLKKSVRLIAAARRARQRFLSVSLASGGIISDEATLLVTQGMYFSDSLSEWIFRVNRLCDELAELNRRFVFRQKDKPQVMLLGSPIVFPNYKIPQLIASAGMKISAVADSSSIAASLAVPETQGFTNADKLLRQIAEIHLKTISSGARVNNTGLYSYFLRLIQQLKPDGIVCHILKGQIEYDFELPYIEKAAERLSIPVFRLETDYQYQDTEQLRIRMEAFGEMLTQRRITEQKRRKYA